MPFESQSHVRGEVDLRSQRLDECDERLHERAADNATVKDLLNKLYKQDSGGGGTVDIQRAVQASVGQAKDTIRSQFEADHIQTKDEQAESESIEKALRANASTDADNAEHLAAARTELHSEEAGQPLDAVERQLRDESDVFQGEAERLHERNEKSRNEAERLLRQVIRDRNH